MTEYTLEWIGQHIVQLQADIRSLRDDIHLLRGEVHLARGDVARIQDTISMDIIERIRALEDR